MAQPAVFDSARKHDERCGQSALGPGVTPGAVESSRKIVGVRGAERSRIQHQHELQESSRHGGHLVQRNLLVYRHSWIVIVSGFFEPLFYLLGIGYGLGTIVGDVTLADGRVVAYAAFVAPALLAQSTMNGAITLAKPAGKEIEFGVVRPGMLADLLVVDANPLENLKVLYGTGWFRLNDSTKKVDQIGGVRYTIKDGIVYDAKQLLADVARMVEEGKRGTTQAGR